MKKIIATNKDSLKKLIAKEIKLNGNTCDLNHIDVSQIDEMSGLFYMSPFNGNISTWDVSNVTNMYYMFALSKFNGDISCWNVSEVRSMSCMFYDKSDFNQDISHWNVSEVRSMSCMFRDSAFTGDLNRWDISNVTNMDSMFYDCSIIEPWWYIEDNDLRKQVIEKRKLKDELMINLDNPFHNSQKIKL